MNQKHKIPNELARVASGRIPNDVARLPGGDKHYVISFKYYNDKLCEIDDLTKNSPKACLQLFKKITRTTLGNLRNENIDQLRIHNSGDYKRLFNSLTHEVDLFEHKLQATSRIFYFISANEFHIVAITQNHLETDKTRR